MLLNLSIALPEFILFIGAMGLLMVGVFTDARSYAIVHWGSVIALLLAALAVSGGGASQLAFNGSFILDDFGRLMKFITFIAMAISVIISNGYMQREGLARFEFPVLALLAATGMGMMISANDLIAMYMGIELQSLALYVLATINRNSLRSSEAGLKYFVLGALSSGLLLYGCSLLYGFSGSVAFVDLASSLHAGEKGMELLPVIGIVFVLAGLAFKVSAVPFHMWTPDVYEGAPTSVTALFAAAPKVAAFALFIRLVFTAMPDAVIAWQQIIIFLSIASMALGAFSAIGQRNLKRLMAYSSIGHMGFALVGFAAATQTGLAGLTIYLAIYVTMTLGTFACILALRNETGSLETIDDLSGLSRTNPMMAICLGVLMFSLAGIPPMAGFFGKFYVFRAAIEAELYSLAIIGVLCSVVGAFYYLRIVKIMYLDEPLQDNQLEPIPRDLSIVAGALTAISMFFFVYPLPLVKLAEHASFVLMQEVQNKAPMITTWLTAPSGL